MELAPLDDTEEKAANDYVYHRFVKKADFFRNIQKKADRNITQIRNKGNDMAKSTNQKAKILYLEKILQGNR